MTSAVLDPTEPPEKRRVRRLVETTIAAWRQSPSDSVPLAGAALRLLDDHPALAAHHSLLLDLAVEEYCLRRDRGETLDPASYAAQFPHVGETLGELLEHYAQRTAASCLPSDAPTFAWPIPNQVVRGFLILNQLGSGTNSRAYLASELALGGRLVVLKVSTKLTNEAVLLGTLAHPHITPILSHHVEDYCRARSNRLESVSFIATPFLGATTLRDVIRAVWHTGSTTPDVRTIVAIARDGALGVDKFRPYPSAAWFAIDTAFQDAVVEILIRLADALHFAHTAGVIHRDIKPSNILLTPTGTPMLMDFGVSVAAHSPSDGIAGTLSYMAPECIAALTETPLHSAATEFATTSTFTSEVDADRCDATSTEALASHPDRTANGRAASSPHYNHTIASDIYSLGAVGFELLTGIPPYGRLTSARHFLDHARNISEQQKSGIIDRGTRTHHIDDRLFRILQRCLALDPSERPLTAGALAAELSEYQRARAEATNVKHQRAIGRRVAVLITIAISLLATGFFALPPPHPQRLEDVRATVHTSVRAGNNDRALAVLDKAIARHEDLTRLKHNSKEETDAIVDHTAILRLLRGETLRQLGRYREADEDLVRAIAFRHDAAALIRSAYVKSQIGDSATARGIYNYAITLHGSPIATRYPRDLAVARNNVAVIYCGSGDIDLADQSLAKISFAALRPEDIAIVAKNRMDVSIGLFDAGILDANELIERKRVMFSRWPTGIIDDARSLVESRVNARVFDRRLTSPPGRETADKSQSTSGDADSITETGAIRSNGDSKVDIGTDGVGLNPRSRTLVPDDLPEAHYNIRDH